MRLPALLLVCAALLGSAAPLSGQDARAAHLLSRATYGARPQDIAESLAGWVH